MKDKILNILYQKLSEHQRMASELGAMIDPAKMNVNEIYHEQRTYQQILDDSQTNVQELKKAIEWVKSL